MQAVILAAGEGTRLEPLTNVRPKPMLPVANRPILEHVVEAAAEAGLDDIVLVVGYKQDRIRNHVGDGNDWGVDITYVVQEPQLGSGDALLQAEAAIGDDIVVLNGDQIVDSEAIVQVMDEREQTGDAVMAATQSAETELYGVIEVENRRVEEIREKPPESTTRSDLINAGVYAFGPEIFAALRDTETDGELALTAALQRQLDRHPVRVVSYEGTWFDVSWPWELLTVNNRLLDSHSGDQPSTASVHETATVIDTVACGDGVSVQPNATVLHGTALGDNVSVGAGAILENTIVMPDATIGAGAILRDCIVGANAAIGPGTVAEGGAADVVIGDRAHHGVQFGGIVGDNARLGGNVTIAPGTRIGNGSTVETDSYLDGQFDPNAVIQRG